jgi:predicted ATPase
VGRARQLKSLTGKLDDLLNGRGALLMLRGEPGIGKSRLLEEFADLAKVGGATVLRGACYDGKWGMSVAFAFSALAHAATNIPDVAIAF